MSEQPSPPFMITHPDVHIPFELNNAPTPGATAFSNLILLVNDYLVRQNPPLPVLPGTSPNTDSDALPEDPEGVQMNVGNALFPSENSAPSTSSSVMPGSKHNNKHQNSQNLCTICKMEEVTVSHFGVDVCTGCRAFFRRSVAQQKTYRCLNSKLCGKNNLVPNRRVCKFCRFQRCIDAGMLKSKEQLYNQKLDQTAPLTPPTPNSLDVVSRAAVSPIADSVLDHYLNFRRKVTYDRLQTYYKAAKVDEDTFVDCTATIAFNLKETQLIIDTLTRSPLFEGVAADDLRFLFGDYSVVWTVQEQIFSTLRSSGQHVRKMHNADGSVLRLNEECAFNYWRPIFLAVRDPRPVISEMVCRFLLSLATYTTLDVTKKFAEAGLSEEEVAAFTALMFTRPELLSQISRTSANLLLNRRQHLFRNLATYILSTGQKVEDRMSKVVLLMTEMQDAVRCLKHAINIIRVTTTEDSCLPKSFLSMFECGARDITTLLQSAMPMTFRGSEKQSNAA
uniref:Nuclear receptor domain-containing protein n=1 Tax=Panagrellus redivivus TaxID=6233 RepID=A0A7E4UPR6_PANRE